MIRLLATQPATVNGSPDTIISRGVRAGGKATGAWAARFSSAVKVRATASEIGAALDEVAGKQQLNKLANPLSDANLHAAMLGAFDADWEAANDKVVAPERFAAGAGGLAPWLLQADNQKGFAARGIDEAVASFEGLGVVTPDVFDQMSAAARKRSFTIAGATNARMLETAKRELLRQIATGADLRDFRKALDARMVAAGWVPKNRSHVETIFRTNVMGAYNGGRLRQQTQPAVLEARPFWQWVAVDDSRARPNHKAAHLRVLRADDPWWQTAYPPAGFNCRCRVITRSASDIKSFSTGASMPPLPDPGFAGGTGALLAA